MSSRSRSFNFSIAHFQKVKNLYIQAVPGQGKQTVGFFVFFFGRVTVGGSYFPSLGFISGQLWLRIELRAVVLQQAGLMCAATDDETPLPTRPGRCHPGTPSSQKRGNKCAREMLPPFLKVCVFVFEFFLVLAAFFSHTCFRHLWFLALAAPLPLSATARVMFK